MRADGVELNSTSFRSLLMTCVSGGDMKAAAATLLEAQQRGVWVGAELSKLATATMGRLANRAADKVGAADTKDGRRAAVVAAKAFYVELKTAGIADQHQRRKLAALRWRKG